MDRTQVSQLRNVFSNTYMNKYKMHLYNITFVYTYFILSKDMKQLGKHERNFCFSSGYKAFTLKWSFTRKELGTLQKTVRLARLWHENPLSKVHRSVTLAHVGEVCRLSHANISVTNILLFKNWMHFLKFYWRVKAWTEANFVWSAHCEFYLC